MCENILPGLLFSFLALCIFTVLTQVSFCLHLFLSVSSLRPLSLSLSLSLLSIHQLWFRKSNPRKASQRCSASSREMCKREVYVSNFKSYLISSFLLLYFKYKILLSRSLSLSFSRPFSLSLSLSLSPSPLSLSPLSLSPPLSLPSRYFSLSLSPLSLSLSTLSLSSLSLSSVLIMYR